MKITINGVGAELKYAPFTEAGGAILRIFLGLPTKEDPSQPSLHQKLADDLKGHLEAVMDKDEIVDGHTEIRLLDFTMLQCIDAMRTLGYGILEVHPHF